jgi:hypothetical protein
MSWDTTYLESHVGGKEQWSNSQEIEIHFRILGIKLPKNHDN